AELESVLGHSFPEGSIVATFHPVTTEPGEAEHQTQQFLDALRQFGRPVLLTMPNADPGGLAVRRIVARFAEEPWLHIHENLGQKLYVAVMANAGLMAGNSSSGIIEAASFDLPVVNVGDRQQGRERSGNVIDSPCTTEGVLEALHLAVGDPSLGHHPNIYGDGKAARRIVEVLSSVELGPRLIKKPFVDR
ncbi:MAG: UDP-N-acetylglucosamine 2-epimerase, partial [Armatimonadetes bacterium]|nr:UDP-N-acetylglucosamine 2-epimerase [Armatimonadota bacterium]